MAGVTTFNLSHSDGQTLGLCVSSWARRTGMAVGSECGSETRRLPRPPGGCPYKQWIRIKKTPAGIIDGRVMSWFGAVCYSIGAGLQRCPSCIATRPHPLQTNFIAASLSLQTCLASTSGAPQKLHFSLSSHGLHRCPGESAMAPQLLHE